MKGSVDPFCLPEKLILITYASQILIRSPRDLNAQPEPITVFARDASRGWPPGRVLRSVYEAPMRAVLAAGDFHAAVLQLRRRHDHVVHGGQDGRQLSGVHEQLRQPRSVRVSVRQLPQGFLPPGGLLLGRRRRRRRQGSRHGRLPRAAEDGDGKHKCRSGTQGIGADRGSSSSSSSSEEHTAG